MPHRPIALLACAVLLSGCGGGGGSSRPKPAQPAAQGGSVEDQLGFTRRGIAGAQAKVENAIATCMKAQGFDYVPVDAAAAQTALTGRPNLSDEEFERQFGYGISTLYGRGSPQSDPNYRIRRQLGAADLRAYDQALSGGQPDQTFLQAVDTGDFSQLGGCIKQATDDLLGGTQLLTTLQRNLDELDDSILADQRMVRASASWTRCMRAATGQEYEDSEAIEDEIRQQFEAIVGAPLPQGQVAPDGSYDKAALADLQRREVELSDHDLACEREHITPVENVVREQKEDAFRQRNADLLRKVKPLG
jgi:hypothetical protein